MEKSFAITGLSHSAYKNMIDHIHKDDRLTLVKDPTNEYDSNAIRVFHSRVQIGWVSAKENEGLLKIWNEFDIMECYVESHNPKAPWPKKLKGAAVFIDED